MERETEQLKAKLRRDPEDIQAYEALKKIYQRREDPVATIDLILGYADRQQRINPAEASRAFREAAEIALHGSNDALKATELYQRALQSNPLNMDAAEELNALLESQGDFQKQASFLQELYATLPARRCDPGYLALICYRLGDLWNQRFMQPEAALECFRRALEHDRNMLAAMFEARLIHLSAGDFLNAAEFYRMEIKAETDRERKARLSCELGELLAEQLGDLDEAIAALRGALAFSPGDISCMHLLATHLIRKADGLAPREAQKELRSAADLLFHIAQGLPDPEAIEYAQSALTNAPDHEEALKLVERLATNSGQLDILPAYWVGYLAARPDGPDTDDRRLALARAYVASEQNEDALYCLKPSARRGHLEASKLYERLRQEMGIEPSYRTSLEDGKPLLSEPATEPKAALPRAPKPIVEPKTASPAEAVAVVEPETISTEELEIIDEAEAVSLAEAKSVAKPKVKSAVARPAADRIERAGTELPPSGKKKAKTDERGVPTVPPPTRNSRTSTQAVARDLTESQKQAAADLVPELPKDLPGLRRGMRDAVAARNDEEAEAYARRILELDAADSGAFALLERYYRRQRDFSKLRELLIACARSPSLPLAIRKARLKNAAALSTDNLEDIDGAVWAWREIVKLDPEDEDAAARLRKLYQDGERWDDLVEMLDGEALEAADAEHEAEIIEQIALIHRDRRHDLAEAADAFRQLCALKPGDDRTRDALNEVLRLAESQKQAAADLVPEPLNDLPRLRQAMRKAAAARNDEEAEAYARQILELDAADSGAFALLERYYHRQRDFSKLREVLIECARSPSLPPAIRKTRLKNAAALSTDKLEDIDGAIWAWREIVKLDPEDKDAAARLRKVLQNGERWDDLVEMLDGEALAAADAEQEAQIFEQIALIHRDRRRDLSEAADAFRQLYALKPGDDRTRDALCEVLLEGGQYEEAIPLIEKRIDAISDHKAKLEQLHVLASLLHEELDDLERARATYERILAIYRDDEVALDRMERIDESSGQPERLLFTLERHAERAAADEKVVLYLRMASVAESQLFDRDRAADYINQAIEIAPDDQNAMEALCELLERDGQHEKLWELLSELATKEQEPERKAQLQARIARLSSEWLGDEEGAADAWQGVLEIREDLEALEFMRYRAERQDDAENLADVLKRLAALQSDAGAKRDLLLERGKLLHERLGRSGDAVAVFRLILDEIDPACDEAADQMLAAGQAAGDRSALVDALEQKLQREMPPHHRIELARKLADLYRAVPADAQRAVRVLQIWAEQDPLDPEPHRRLLEPLEAGKLYKDMVAALDTLAELEPQAKARQLAAVRAAELVHTRLGNVDGAWHRLAPLVEEGVEAAVEALASVAVAGDRLQDLYQLLPEGQAEEQVELARHLADMLNTEVDDPNRVASALQKWAEIDEHNPEPHRRLRPLLEQSGRFEELIATLDALAFLEPEEEQRRQAALEAAELAFEKFGDATGAWERLAPLVEQDWKPASRIIVAVAEKAERLDELCELLERVRRYSELVEILQKRAAEESRPETKVEILRRIARIKSNRLGDDEGAEQVWNSVLEIKEDSEALRFLRSAAIKRDDVELLADVLKRLAALVGENEERRDLFFEYACLLNARLDRPRDAMEVIRVILDAIDPQFEPAIDALVSIAERLGNQTALAEALEKRLAVRSNSGRRIEIVQRLSGIYESKSKDAGRAVQALQSWAEADPGALEPWRKLREVLLDAHHYQEAVEVLDTLAAREEEERERQSAVIAAAEVLSQKLNDIEGAWKRLTPLVLARCDAAEDALHALACEFKQERRLADLYTALAQQEPDPKISAGHWQSAARIFEEYLGQPEQAFEALLRRLAVDIHDRSYLEDAERVADKAGAWPRMVQVYARLLKQAGDPRERADLLDRHAHLLENVAKDPRAALDLVLKACSLDPRNDLWLERADRLCRQTDRTDDLLWVCKRRLQNADTKTKRIELLIDAARIVDRVAQDREQAIAYFAEALDLCEGSSECIDRIELVALQMDKDRPIGEDQDVRRALVDTYRKLARTADPQAAVSLLLRASRLLSAALNNDHGSFDVLKEALVRFPENHEVYTSTEELAVRIGRLDALDAQMARLLARELPEPTRVAMLERRLGLLLNRMNRYDEAVDICRKLLEIDPEHAEPARSLEISLEKSGRYLELVRYLELRLQKEQDQHLRMEIMRTIASIWEDQLMNCWEAGEMWKMIVELDPENAEALAALERLKAQSPTSVHPPPPDE